MPFLRSLVYLIRDLRSISAVNPSFLVHFHVLVTIVGQCDAKAIGYRHSCLAPPFVLFFPFSPEAMEGIDEAKLPLDDSKMLEEEAQEDLLMLQAHMGHFDHLLETGASASHLVDPYPLKLPNTLSKSTGDIERPQRSKSEVIELLDDSDEEEPAKGSSQKKRRANGPVMIDLEDEEDSGEEDLDVMKMKRYPPVEEMAMPQPKRQNTFPMSPAAPTISQSAPVTPMPEKLIKPTLIATGRYYDDTTLSTRVKNCRFCAAEHGVAFHGSSAPRLSCFICGAPHIAKECPNIMCYNCWEMGHRSKGCRNPRVSKAPCFRCGGTHDSMDCLPIKGLVRLGTPIKTKKAKGGSKEDKSEEIEAVPLPPQCANCGFTGHTIRECSISGIEDTNDAFDRDGPSWLARARQEIRRMVAKTNSTPDHRKQKFERSSSAEKHSYHHHQQHHHNKTPSHDRTNSMAQSNSNPSTPSAKQLHTQHHKSNHHKDDRQKDNKHKSHHHEHRSAEKGQKEKNQQSPKFQHGGDRGSSFTPSKSPSQNNSQQSMPKTPQLHQHSKQRPKSPKSEPHKSPKQSNQHNRAPIKSENKKGGSQKPGHGFKKSPNR